jgi:hypothetical protein
MNLKHTIENKLIPFFKEVLTLPFVSNAKEFNKNESIIIVRGHEMLIKEKLIKHELAFKHQPNGSQKSPDFRINLDKKKFLDVEIKSSKKTYPIYDSGLPQKNTVYIFCSEEYDATTIYFGQDIITDRKRELYNELIIELKEVVSKYQNKPC